MTYIHTAENHTKIVEYIRGTNARYGLTFRHGPFKWLFDMSSILIKFRNFMDELETASCHASRLLDRKRLQNCMQAYFSFSLCLTHAVRLACSHVTALENNFGIFLRKHLKMIRKVSHNQTLLHFF